MKIGIGDWDQRMGSGIGIRDLDWGLGIKVCDLRIGHWRFGIGIWDQDSGLESRMWIGIEIGTHI